MADGIYIDTSGFKGGRKAFQNLIKRIPNEVNDALNSSALEIKAIADRNLSKNGTSYLGALKTALNADTSKFLYKQVTARTPYAAYVEFGTGKFAAQAVSALPAKYHAFAAQFKTGGGNRSIKGMLFLLTNWFVKKGIKDKNKAYFIARSIVINGTHPHPFLIPALIQQEPILLRELQTLLNNLKA